MMKFFTLNYLINYGNKSGNTSVPDAFLNDFDTEMYEPAPESVNAILNFAKSYGVMELQTIGNSELILN